MELMIAANANFANEDKGPSDFLRQFAESYHSGNDDVIDYGTLLTNLRKQRIAETQQRLGLRVVAGTDLSMKLGL